MAFGRRKEEGVDTNHRKLWVSARPRGEDVPTYRIIWRDEFAGVTVPEGFQVSYQDDNGRWQLLTGQKLKKTFNAAKKLCEEHRQSWLASASQRSRAASRPVVLTGRGRPEDVDTDDASTETSPSEPTPETSSVEN